MAGRLALAALTLSLLVAAAPAARAQGLSFIRDAEIEDLLNQYARPLFRAAGLGSSKIRIRIVRDKAFNAFVLDGKNVFVNSGALVQAETPNEIIGVIAHETGHIAGGHMAGLRAKVAKDATRNLLMKILGMGAAVAGGIMGKDSDAGELASGAGKGILSGADAVTMRSILSYRRVQEGAADQAGISYLNATKQSGNGMLVTFERFAQQELFSDRLKDPYVLSHPMARDRIAQLRDLAAKSPYFSVTDPPELQLRHDLMRAKLVGYLEPPQTVFNRYPSSDTSMPARYARAIATFFSGGIEPALPMIDELIAEKPDYAYFWELKGDLLQRRGDQAGAVAPLRKALKLAGNSSLIRIALAQALLGTGEPGHADEAVELLRKALVDEDHAQGYRLLANAYYQRGDEGGAYLASAQASLLEGNIKDAKSFARRAQGVLKQGSPGWLKADDIINIESPS